MIRVASENNAAMVILGTTGRTKRRLHLLRRNTAEHVIDKINCDLALKPSGMWASGLTLLKVKRVKQLERLNARKR